MEKTGNWLLGVGAILLFLGLCVLAAALGDRSETSVLEVGFLLSSFGGVNIGLGLYLKARSLQLASPEAKIVAEPGRRLRGGCDLCGMEMPVIQCRVHQVHMCGDCLAKHYDIRSCTYAPSNRRVVVRGTAKAMAAHARA